MISKFEDFNELFKEIDKTLAKKAHLYVIGGAMLLYHGIKDATKDIDIIVETPQEFLQLQKSLKDMGFATRMPTLEYKKVDLNQIFVREDFRLDLFQKTVCKGFSLSKAMQKRAQNIIKLQHLMVSLCSGEDVFLFKTFTEREGDISDCLGLAQRGIDWNAILGEVQSQIKTTGNHVWITWVGERLDILEERGLEIPIMGEVNILREAYFEDYEKRHKT
ncbi:hypothetical protein HZB01_02840 [Candidatus Woesearchaeota archaeon]|nr:hypothetical protein [Candidatus Woesearchaeota archaeon]